MIHVNPETTILTKEELEEFIRLTKKIGWREKGTEVFESLFPLTPMVPFELAVVNLGNEEPQVLMWHRKDKHYEGWHMPGGYIRPGESDSQVVERVLAKETGLKLTRMSFIRCFNNRPGVFPLPNHQMAKFWYCLTEGTSSQGQYFPLDNLPERTLPHHTYMIQHLKAYLLRKDTMNRFGIRLDNSCQAPEGKWLVASPSDPGSPTICNTLNGALSIWESSNREIHIFDDEGRQIV